MKIEKSQLGRFELPSKGIWVEFFKLDRAVWIAAKKENCLYRGRRGRLGSSDVVHEFFHGQVDAEEYLDLLRAQGFRLMQTQEFLEQNTPDPEEFADISLVPEDYRPKSFSMKRFLARL